MNYLREMIVALIDGQDDLAKSCLSEHINKKASVLINEDHEKFMTSAQMEQHIKTLFSEAPDKSEFLKVLGKYSSLDNCSERDFKKCANNIQSKGKVHMDKAIHALEELIGYEFSPDSVKEGFHNIIRRVVPGVPNNNADIPNVFTNKNIPRKKKKLPTLKKNVYGTGLPPSNASGDREGGPIDGGADGGASGGGE